FTGNMKEHKDEIMNMEGYKYYFQKEVEKISFYKDYLESLLSDEGNHQQLSIEFE
ncbi:metallophosphoesterase, partial [Coprobacillus cateniformis]|nr:metallophosphoesterase [Coprobacillus cateniformis]